MVAAAIHPMRRWLFQFTDSKSLFSTVEACAPDQNTAINVVESLGIPVELKRTPTRTIITYHGLTEKEPEPRVLRTTART